MSRWLSAVSSPYPHGKLLPIEMPGILLSL